MTLPSLEILFLFVNINSAKELWESFKTNHIFKLKNKT